eukprot:305916_1
MYYFFGRRQDHAIYVSDSLQHVISYDLINNQYEIVDVRTNTVSAYSNGITEGDVYPFLVDTDEWHEDGVLHYDDIPDTKVQCIVITQRNRDTSVTNNVLNIAEIEIFPKYNPNLNIAPTHAQCFNYPINPDWYWYSGDDLYGQETRLNDQDISSASQNGGTSASDCMNTLNPCLNVCFLNESIEIDHIKVYPPQNSWRFS